MVTETRAWRILAVSVVGTSHQHAGRGCDDAHGYRQLADGTLLLAAADGAGSAARSAEGAACAVQTAINRAEAMLTQEAYPSDADGWQTTLSTLLQETRSALNALASPNTDSTDESSAAPSLLRDFATTLLLTVVTSDWVAAAQVGDGATVIQATDTTLQTITQPQHGEYVNETTFLTSSDYLAQAQYSTQPHEGIRAVALLTDGLERLALNFTEDGVYAHVPFFGPVFAFAAEPHATEAELAAFLDSERVCAETDDDKTLILAVRT